MGIYVTVDMGDQTLEPDGLDVPAISRVRNCASLFLSAFNNRGSAAIAGRSVTVANVCYADLDDPTSVASRNDSRCGAMEIMPALIFR